MSNDHLIRIGERAEIFDPAGQRYTGTLMAIEPGPGIAPTDWAFCIEGWLSPTDVSIICLGPADFGRLDAEEPLETLRAQWWRAAGQYQNHLSRRSSEHRQAAAADPRYPFSRNVGITEPGRDAYADDDERDYADFLYNG